MGEHGSGQRIPIKQIYKSLVELQHFSTFRLFKMIAAITVTTVVACMLRLLFNDQEPFSFDIATMLSPGSMRRSNWAPRRQARSISSPPYGAWS